MPPRRTMTSGSTILSMSPPRLKVVPRSDVPTLLGLLAAALGLPLYVSARGPDAALLQGITLYSTIAIAGWLIARVQPRNRIGQVLVATGIGAGALLLAVGVVVAYSASPHSLGGPVIAQAVAQGAFLSAWLLFAVPLPFAAFVLLFPDGHLPRPAWRLPASLGLVGSIVAAIVLALSAPAGTMPDALGLGGVAPDVAGPLQGALGGTPLVAAANGFSALLLPAAVIGLVDRFRGGGPLLRQQVKWFLAGVFANLVIGLVAGPFEAAPGVVGGSAKGIELVATPLPLVGAAIGVLRYRLWNVDVVVARAGAAALTWAAFAVALSGFAIVAGLAVAGGDVRTIPALVIALVVATALPSLRRPVERKIERLLGGSGGYLAVRRLGERAELHRGVNDLARAIVEAARAAVRVEWAALWLADTNPTRPHAIERPLAFRAAGAVGTPGPLPPTIAPEATTVLGSRPRLWSTIEDVDPASQLVAAVWDLDPGAVAALDRGGGAIGVLVVGPRMPEPLEESDLDVLAALASESALRLENLLLEAELRARLEDLARQAEELRASRTRIVEAEDAARRQIQRDLHDGLQQELVDLAARIRRLAGAAGVDVGADLLALSADAEAAVFALREVSRGIYPSTLDDLGLVAAVGDRVARMAANVDVEADRSLLESRLPAPIEEALYFIAMEALTNAAKHAPEARIWVRIARDGGSVRLEVEDDGLGSESRIGARRADVEAGGGVLNMIDRAAAHGGSLTVAERLGGGMRVAVEIPLEVPPIVSERQPVSPMAVVPTSPGASRSPEGR